MRIDSVVLIVILSVASVTAFGADKTPVEKTSKKEDPCIKKARKQFKKALEPYLLFANKNVLPSVVNSQKSAAPTPTPVELPPLLLSQFAIFEYLLSKLNCLFPPMKIYGGVIKRYPPTAPPDPPCVRDSIIMDLPPVYKDADILKSAQDVGRLAIRTGDRGAPSFWGTGFLIAQGVVAAPCHVIAPLLDEKPKRHLALERGEHLLISFGTEGTPGENVEEFEIKRFITCSEVNGLDVALLDLCDLKQDGHSLDCPKTPGDPMPLFSGKFSSIQGRISILVGYGDMEHFIDPDRRAMYDPWVQNSYAKFVMGDIVGAKDECDEGLEIILDTDVTTVGESGSVVMYFIPDKDSTKPAKSTVVGMHTCCNAFFEYSEGKPPDPYLKCARLRRTFHSQDISSWSMRKDPNLCRVLKDRKATLIDESGTETKISCSTL